MRSVPTAGTLATALLAVGLAGAALGAAPGDDEQRFARLLDEAGRAASEAERERIAAELASLPGAVGLLLEARAADLAADFAGPEDPAAGRLAVAQRRTLDRLAEGLGLDAVVEALGSATIWKRDACWRQCAFELLQGRATAAQLSLLVRLLTDARGEAPEDGPLVQAFRATLTEVARRDVRLLAELPHSDSMPTSVRRVVLRAVGSAGDPAALSWVAKHLEQAELEELALQEIARIAARAAPGSVPGLAAKLRPYLGSADAGRRRNAARAVAALGDTRSIPILIVSLGKADEGGRAAVHSALVQLAGRGLPAQAAAWEAWYRGELAWIDARESAALEGLASEQDADVVEALRELSAHTLGRERWSLEIARGPLQHASAQVRSQACLTLALLRCEVVVEELIDALEDSDQAVRRHAATALSAITGREPGSDPRAAREARLPSR